MKEGAEERTNIKLCGDCARYYSADHNDDNFYKNNYWQYTFSYFVSFSFFEKTTGPDRRATYAANAAVPLYTHFSTDDTPSEREKDNHGQENFS